MNLRFTYPERTLQCSKNSETNKYNPINQWLEERTSSAYHCQEYSGIFEPLPDHMGARLMFYLHCVHKVMDIRDADTIEKLIDYEHFVRLSSSEVDKLVIMAIALAPDRLLNKCFIENDELCGDLLNEFYHKDELEDAIKVYDFIRIGNESRYVYKIMCFKKQFLHDNYYEPLRFYKNKIDEIVEEIEDFEKSKRKDDGPNNCFCVLM